jgi:inosose dehydratase
MQLRVANAPTSWGIEDPADPANPPWARVLDEVAGAGYAGMELGPLGYLPNGDHLKQELATRDLELVAGFVFEPLHDPDGLGRALRTAAATCEVLAATGAGHLVIIQGFTPERESTAGRPGAGRALAESEWVTLIEGVHSIARLAAEEHGLVPCFHPHAGTYVEFEDEIERLIAGTDPELVSLCIDTGHCAYAGIDPVALFRRHSERVAYFHLKDLQPDRLHAKPMSFEEAVADGVFCPLGEGVVDFGALRAVLVETDFDGWAAVEQDRLPTDASSPAEHAAASLRHLRDVGLGG